MPRRQALFGGWGKVLPLGVRCPASAPSSITEANSNPTASPTRYSLNLAGQAFSAAAGKLDKRYRRRPEL